MKNNHFTYYLTSITIPSNLKIKSYLRLKKYDKNRAKLIRKVGVKYMIALASLDELQKTKLACEQIHTKYPELFESISHLVSLTRQLQFQYPYMVSLLIGEDASLYTPKHTRESVLALYHDEVNRLKTSKYLSVLRQFFLKHKHCGYDNISLIILGRTPEYLKGI